MKKTGIVLGSCVAVLVLAGAWMLHDDALDPGAQAWLEAVEARQAGPSEAFDLMLGLDAPLGVEPRQLGRQRREAYARQRDSGDSEPLAVLQTPPGLPVPTAEQTCHAAETACLARIAAAELLPQRLLDEYAVLLQRYRQVLALDDYRTLTRLGADEPLAQFRLLIQGNQLLALQALQLSREGEAAAARELLETDIARVRRQLSRSDQLIGKMVWARLLGRDLDLLARLYVDGLIGMPNEQPALSDVERNLQAPVQREFAMKAVGMLELRKTSGWHEGFPVPGMWLLFKPRQTVNLMFAPDRALAERSHLDAAAFRQSLAARTTPVLSAWQQPDNPIGVILANVASPDMDTYVARLHDLDAKLRLFNLLRQLPAGAAPTPDRLALLENADNPYRPGELPTWHAQPGQLCFDGPLPDPNATRCLVIAAARPD